MYVIIMNPKDIGNFLTKLRKEAGLTQEELSEYLHLTHQAVSKWETGNGIPDILTIIELSNLYNVTIGEIFSGERSTDEKERPKKVEVEKPIINIKGYVRKKNRQRRIKKCILNGIPIFLALLIFAFIFLLCFYKTNRIYSLTYSDNALELYNSIIYINDKHITWKTGTITYNDKSIPYDNTIITLYYENNSNYIEFMKFSYDGEDKICNYKECKKLKRYIRNKNLIIKIKTIIDNESVEFVFNPQVIKIDEDKEKELYANDATNLKNTNYLSNKNCLYKNGYKDYDELTMYKVEKIKGYYATIYIKKNNIIMNYSHNEYDVSIDLEKIRITTERTIEEYIYRIDGKINYSFFEKSTIDFKSMIKLIENHKDEYSKILVCNNQ